MTTTELVAYAVMAACWLAAVAMVVVPYLAASPDRRGVPPLGSTERPQRASPDALSGAAREIPHDDRKARQARALTTLAALGQEWDASPRLTPRDTEPRHD